MAKTEQEIGQERVLDILIRPLERLGLARPKGTPVAAFEDMKRELCARLWRLHEGALQELCEWVIEHPEAKANRFPPAAAILAEAKPMLPPAWPPSDRMVKIFRHAIGAAALRDGWAPELFRRFVGRNDFPNDFSAGMALKAAGPQLEKMKGLDAKVAAGHALTPEEARWRDGRLNLIAHCERIRDYVPGAVA
jgi:hypothetical protein